MSISQKGLFKIALGLEEPWYIRSIDFNVEEKQLDLRIDFESGSRFLCPICGNSECHVHDTINRTWRHLNFFQFKTYLHCRVPRIECEKCGVKQVKVPWARRSSGFTLLMDSLIVLMAQNMPVKVVADLIGSTIREYGEFWNTMSKKLDLMRTSPRSIQLVLMDFKGKRS